jgi:drug/metabolite transporter (DMT)-like permease
MDLVRLATVVMMMTTSAAADWVSIFLSHNVSFRNALCLMLVSMVHPVLSWAAGRRERNKQKMIMTTTMKPWWMIVTAAALLAPGWTNQFLGTTTLFVAAQEAVRFCYVVVVEQWANMMRHHRRLTSHLMFTNSPFPPTLHRDGL